jgi:hypothetical protein
MPAAEFISLDLRKSRAMKLLGPGVREISVHAAIMSVERAKHPRTRTYPRSAAQKKWAKRLAKVLRALPPLLRDPDAVPDVAGDILRYTEDHLGRWQKEAEATATIALPPGYGKPYARAKHIAAACAEELLREQDKPVTCTRKPEPSQFLELAALLFGDPRADVYTACCRVKAGRRFRE